MHQVVIMVTTNTIEFQVLDEHNNKLNRPNHRAKESMRSGTGEREVTQVVLVNEFTDLTLTGETSWQMLGMVLQSGGILAIWCTGTLTLAGAILNANTKGFQGGQSASTSNDGDNQTGMGNRGYLQLSRTGLGGAGGGSKTPQQYTTRFWWWCWTRNCWCKWFKW